MICDELKKSGVEYIAWVPDSETHFIHEAMLGDPSLRVVQVCSEGEGIALCIGLHMGAILSEEGPTFVSLQVDKGPSEPFAPIPYVEIARRFERALK